MEKTLYKKADNYRTSLRKKYWKKKLQEKRQKILKSINSGPQKSRTAKILKIITEIESEIPSKVPKSKINTLHSLLVENFQNNKIFLEKLIKISKTLTKTKKDQNIKYALQLLSILAFDDQKEECIYTLLEKNIIKDIVQELLSLDTIYAAHEYIWFINECICSNSGEAAIYQQIRYQELFCKILGVYGQIFCFSKNEEDLRRKFALFFGKAVLEHFFVGDLQGACFEDFLGFIEENMEGVYRDVVGNIEYVCDGFCKFAEIGLFYENLLYEKWLDLVKHLFLKVKFDKQCLLSFLNFIYEISIYLESENRFNFFVQDFLFDEIVEIAFSEASQSSFKKISFQIINKFLGNFQSLRILLLKNKKFMQNLINSTFQITNTIYTEEIIASFVILLKNLNLDKWILIKEYNIDELFLKFLKKFCDDKKFENSLIGIIVTIRHMLDLDREYTQVFVQRIKESEFLEIIAELQMKKNKEIWEESNDILNTFFHDCI